MHKVSNEAAPVIFNEIFKQHSHEYPMGFFHDNFSLKNIL